MPKLFGASASPFVRKVRVVLAEEKIPAWQDGDRSIADSSVICAYLERTHPEPRLYPADPYEYARALWFEEYADTALVNVVGPKIFFQKFVRPRFFNQPTDEGTVQ